MLQAGHKMHHISDKYTIKKNLTNLTKAVFITQCTALFTIIPLSITFLPHPAKDSNQKEVKGDNVILTPLEYPKITLHEHTPTPTAVQKSAQPTPSAQSETSDEQVHLQATQIDETTWTVSVENDTSLGTAAEIFNALNAYRVSKGKAPLAQDDKLSTYAQGRADLFASQGATDKHAGFNSYLDGEGFNELGYNSIGENSSFGYHVSGKKLIEEVYASDAPHDNNQLAEKWTHVGIGVNGVATDIIFAGNKQ